ncbi:MAG: acyl carrier protein [Saprospirales bacterium]|nr:MAG: acyl carrier protein [Saprospirales bacterium]
MNETEIRQAIFHSLKQIAPDTDPSSLLPDKRIQESLNIDSFDYLQFIVSLDEKFGIDIPEQDYGKITTVRALTNYILTRLQDED